MSSCLGLTERQSIERQRLLQPVPSILVATQGKSHDSPLEFRIARVNPVGGEVAQPVVIFGCGGFKDRSPGIVDCFGQRGRSVRSRHVLSDRVPLVAIHPPLTLLEVNRVAREVPMDNRMAPPVEVDSFLAYRGGREHEGPERRVKGRPDLGKSGLILTLARAAKAHREPARERDALAVKVIDVGCAVDRLPYGNGPPCGCGQRDQPLICRRVGP